MKSVGTKHGRRLIRAHVVWGLITLLSGLEALAAPTIFDKGVTIKQDGVVPGYVIATARNNMTYAVNVDGNVVAAWGPPAPIETMRHARPLANGNLLFLAGTRGTPGPLVEMTQDGQIVWSYEGDPDVAFHHDHERLSNGNTLILCSREIIAPAVSDQPLQDDCLLEVTSDGTVVWDWQTADHYDDFGYSDEKMDAIFDHAGDWAHANSASPIPDDSPHADPRFRPGNVIIGYRHTSTIAIVDRDTDEIVWAAENLTVGQHNAHMLPAWVPGSGLIMAFDNGLGEMYVPTARRSSRIVEIDPNSGSSNIAYDATKSGLPEWTFYSSFISSVQRLPNGNMFINEGQHGRFFEVDSDGAIQWELVVPPVVSGEDLLRFGNSIYRAYKVPLGWLQQ